MTPFYIFYYMVVFMVCMANNVVENSHNAGLRKENIKLWERSRLSVLKIMIFYCFHIRFDEELKKKNLQTAKFIEKSINIWHIYQCRIHLFSKDQIPALHKRSWGHEL